MVGHEWWSLPRFSDLIYDYLLGGGWWVCKGDILPKIYNAPPAPLQPRKSILLSPPDILGVILCLTHVRTYVCVYVYPYICI